MKAKQAMKSYKVTVLVEGNRPETHTVQAEREGLAKTTAMAFYTQPLAGQEVRYEVSLQTNYYLAYPRAGGRTILAVEGAFPADTHILVMKVEPIENGCYAAECGDVYNAEGVYCGILPEKHPARDRLPPKTSSDYTPV